MLTHVLLLVILGYTYSELPSGLNYSPQITIPFRELPLELSSDGLHLLVSIAIGSPPQKLVMLLDTASSKVIVFDNYWCNDEYHQLTCFNLTKSSSIQRSESLQVLLQY